MPGKKVSSSIKNPKTYEALKERDEQGAGSQDQQRSGPQEEEVI